MKMSKEAQAFLNTIDFEEVELSTEKKQDIYNLVMEKAGITTAQANNVLPMGKPKRKSVPVYLIAAVIATFGLLGAGYATSVYFEKMYRVVDIPDSRYGQYYDPGIDDPHLLVDPPAFQDTATNDGTVITLESYESLGQVFSGRAPGEAFQAEIHTPDQKWMAQGLTGNALGVLHTVNETGLPQNHLVVNPEQAPTVQQVLDKMVSEGQFTITLDHPGFTPTNLVQTNGTPYLSLYYQDRDGKPVSILYDRMESQMPISEELVKDAEIADFSANGNQFVLMSLNEDDTRLILYVGDAQDVIISQVSIYYAWGTREQVLDIMKHITVHNPEANRFRTVDSSFFAGMPNSSLKANADEISAAFKNGTGWGQPVWEKDGLSVTRFDDAGRYLEAAWKEPFDKASPSYPLSAHTAIVDQDWFPGGQLDNISLLYENTQPAGVNYSSEDGTYWFSATPFKDGFARTPLDAMLSLLYNDLDLQQVKVIDAGTGAPFLVHSDPERGRAYIYSAVKDGSGFIVQSLGVPLEELPAALG